jgi:hypothetical protein
MRVKKNSKLSHSSAKVGSFDTVIGKWYSYLQNIAESSKLAKEHRNNKQNQYVNCLRSFFGYHIFEYCDYAENRPNNGWFHPKKQTISPTFSGQFFCDYIAAQLSFSTSFKDQSFKKNFDSALKKIARKFVKTQNFRLVSGIKIVCSGK